MAGGGPDLLDPSWWQDLGRVHSFFTWARANEPVYRDEANRIWAVTRHADVLDVEHRPTVFSNDGAWRAAIAYDEASMIAKDDPQHLLQRRLLSREFTPRAVHVHDELLRALTEEIVDAATQQGEVDVVDALAAPFPSRVISAILGFPDDRWRDVRSWSERLVRTDSAERDAQAGVDLAHAIMELNGAVQKLVADRRRCPSDDVVGRWVAAGYTNVQLVHEAALFVGGGSETTRTTISRGLRAFVDHPDQWEAIAADPSLVPGAVDEVIRWVTPINNMFRTVAADALIGEVKVTAGDRVMLVYPSANRDEDTFDDPFAFDIRRSPNPHLAFGSGAHYCLGVNLAKLELRMLFEALARRWTDLRAVSEPDIEANLMTGAVRSFRLAFSPR